MIQHRLILAAFVFVLCSATGMVHAQWKAGAAKTQITPNEFMLMAGYGSRTEPANGKLTELWAKALVIEDANERKGVIITLDLVGIDRKLSTAICKKLETQGFQRDQIVICTSHTHTGPVVGMNLAPLHYLIANDERKQQIDSYANQLTSKISQVVTNADANLEPVELTWGNGRATFAVNRRANKPYDKVPDWRTEGLLKGPVDHDVPVLAARNKNGELTAILFGYACHATVLGINQWSADYPGFAQIELENRHPNCVALFWAGCGADQNPLPRKSVSLAVHYGRRLANAVDSVLMTSKMKPIEGDLKTRYREINLPLDELPTKSQIEADAQSANKFVAARAKLLLNQLESGPLSQTCPYPISCWNLGNDIQFVFLGGEVVVDYAVRLKSELRGTKTWVAGYANDVMAYIPSRRVLLEGGYEGGGAMVYYGLPTIWAPSVESNIVQAVRDQLNGDQRPDPVDIGSRLELFIDSHLIESLQGDVARKVMLPEPKEVVLVTDQPWEGNTSGYYSLFQDGDIYRMIYRGWEHNEDKKPAHQEVTCYAESKDGVHWTKPNLGLFEWNGSKENNIVWLGPGTHNFTAFRDDNPNAPKEQRYKAFAGSGGKGGLSRGLIPFSSPDCKRWTPMHGDPVITNGAFDSQNLAFWDTDRDEYRAYWRYFGDNVRSIRTATSDDFIHWKNEADLSYAEGTPTEHLYTNAIQKYFRADHLFVGFPTRYEPKSQQVEPILMSSRDGVHFHRFNTPVIPRTAPKDRNHNRSNYMTWGMFQLPNQPDEISVYATENYYEQSPGRLRRFVYRTDGFVAVSAGNKGGEMQTRPLRHQGNRLILNYQAHDGGSLRVIAKNESGEVIASAKEMTGNSTRQEVLWQEGSIQDQGTIQLNFELRNAELFSIQFQNSDDE